MSFTLTRTLPRTATLSLRLNAARTMSSNPAISNPAKSETETRGPQFGFSERQPTAEEKKVMDDVLNLCKFPVGNVTFWEVDLPMLMRVFSVTSQTN